MSKSVFHPLGTLGSSFSAFLRIQIFYSFFRHFMCFLLDAYNFTIQILFLFSLNVIKYILHLHFPPQLCDCPHLFIKTPFQYPQFVPIQSLYYIAVTYPGLAKYNSSHILFVEQHWLWVVVSTFHALGLVIKGLIIILIFFGLAKLGFLSTMLGPVKLQYTVQLNCNQVVEHLSFKLVNRVKWCHMKCKH